MHQLGLSNDELMEILEGKELSPDLIVKVIERNNERILKQLTGPEFMEQINDYLLEKLYEAARL